MSVPDPTEQLIAHRALESLPSEWIDLAHGRISADEAAERAREHESPEVVERSRALFEPPPAAEEERHLGELLEAHFPESQQGWGRRWWIGAAVAVAAAVLLLVVPPWLRSSPNAGPSAAFDAEYSLTTLRGYEGMRSADVADSEVTTYVEGRVIELRLRPSHEVVPPPAVRVFASSGEQSLVLSVEPKISELGVVTILGSTEALGLAPGRWRLWVVLGPEGVLPASVAEIEQDSPEYEVSTAEIEVVRPDELPSPG